MRNTVTTYGWLAKVLHWLMALGLIGMFVLAYYMSNLPPSPFKGSLYGIHKSTGLLLLALVTFRGMWRSINPQPALIHLPRWHQFFARTNIILLYSLMVFLPLSGILMSKFGGRSVSFYNLFTLPLLPQHPEWAAFFHQAHSFLAYALMYGFILHLAGALYHHFILKDDILKRMWLKRF